jgi:pimeloyl-ACP methyl ester carboxylesterase
MEGYQLNLCRSNFYQEDLPTNLVTLVHGLGENYSVFNRQIKFLNQMGYSTLAIDLQAHGKCTNRERVSIVAQARLLHQISEENNLPPTNLIGFSLGGAVALQYTLVYPQQVNRLCLINPALCGEEYLTKKTKLVVSCLQALRPWICKDKDPRRKEVDLSATPYSNAYFSFLNGLRATSINGICQNLEALSEYCLPICLSRIDVPTLIIRSEDDELLTEKVSKDLCSRIPNSYLRSIPGNHVIMLDQTTEVNNLLIEWLSKECSKK